MKTTNYRLQTEIEHLTPTSQKDWFKNYVREILESDKPYHAVNRGVKLGSFS